MNIQSGIRHLQSLSETQTFAREFAAYALQKPRLLIMLDGPMGAGKTQFTKFFVEALGGEETTSPSFAIHHTYAISIESEKRVLNVEHFDLFRLESTDDLESTGFWDFFRAKQGLIIIEWSDRLKELGLFSHLPKSWSKTCFRFSMQSDAAQSRVVDIS
jgi:tRNA threonylcarbamoyladenosine biosynthesis protein TsaE